MNTQEHGEGDIYTEDIYTDCSEDLFRDARSPSPVSTLTQMRGRQKFKQGTGRPKHLSKMTRVPLTNLADYGCRGTSRYMGRPTRL